MRYVAMKVCETEGPLTPIIRAISDSVDNLMSVELDGESILPDIIVDKLVLSTDQYRVKKSSFMKISDSRGERFIRCTAYTACAELVGLDRHGVLDVEKIVELAKSAT